MTVHPFLFSILLLIFVGCSHSDRTETLPKDFSSVTDEENGTEIYNGEEYIGTVAGDTVPVADLAVAPAVPAALPLLVILLEYDNQTLLSDDATWAQKIFGESESELNSYYKEISNDQFRFTPVSESYNTADDGIVKVHLSRNHPDTDIDSPLFYTKLAQDIGDAITAVDPYVDFSNYDNNADGALQSSELTVIFVIAGYEDAYAGGHVTNGIWAHQNALQSSDAPTLDGVSLFDTSKGGKFALFGERHKDSDGEHDATVGIIAHELGHAVFDLPDLYDVTESSAGIGIFGLMGSGTWTRKNTTEFYGDTPTHMSAWSKSFIGWVTPREYANTSAVLYETASSSYNVIKIPISANHYYLLENRNDSGYDRGLRMLEGAFGGGLLIWHIDLKKLTTDEFENNSVNADLNEKGVDVVEANDPVLDSDPSSPGNAKALFYYPNRSRFGSKITKISTPGNAMNLEIH